jgi:hypothetical protein
MGAVDVISEFTLKEDATPEAKLTQLETYVRELRTLFSPVYADIQRLDKAIEQAEKHADTAAEQALIDAKAELQRSDKQRQELHAVDLHIAAAGALIMAAGYALSFFSCFRF